jgi:cyclase
MRRMVVCLAVCLVSLLLLAPFARGQSFDVSKVANGVYAGIGRNGVFSNGAFVVDQNDVLVVDTHLRPSWARDLLAEIHKVTNNPVRYVVNTHWHPDHTQGNQVYLSAFGPTVEYLAQHNTREDLIKKGIPSVEEALTKDVPQEIQTIDKALADGKDPQGNALTPERRTAFEKRLSDDKSYLEELKQIQVTLPTMTFEKNLILHKPGRRISILYFGKGHTRGDVVAYLPKEKVVITGDLLTNGIPFMRDAYPVEWVATLQALRNLDWDVAIPGHGDVQHGKDQIDKLISYMQDMVAAVKDSVAKGQTLEEAKKSIDLSKHAGDFPNFAQSNNGAIERCWAEVTGKIQD